ncbi:SctQ family type III secretion system ring protein Spa33, partial [Shigella sonnei]
RFSIQTSKNKFTGSESLVTLTSVCGDWVIRIDTLSFLKKKYEVFSGFSTQESLLHLSKCVFIESSSVFSIPELSDKITFRITNEIQYATTGSHLCCFSSSLGIIYFDKMPVLRNQVSLDLLHHLLEFCLGSSNVRLATLKRIRTGDIIIVQKLYNLLLCNQVIIGDYIVNDNNEAKINLSESNGESEHTEVSLALFNYDDINVKVDFILLEKNMTINELKMYVENELFKFPDDIVKHVNIKVNGSLVGHGELVSIEDGYGIEISSWMVKE